MKVKSFTIKPKAAKKRGAPVPPTKVMKSKKDYNRKNKGDEMEEQLNTRALLSKFITNIFEKNYSDANEILSLVITEKMKNKIKNATGDKKCDCGCDDCKKNKKKVLKSK